MSAKRKDIPALPKSKELSEPPPDPGTFEDIPKIQRIADDSAGPRLKGKVAIITGAYSSYNGKGARPTANQQKNSRANSALGIGRATAHQFAQNGAKAVFLCDFGGDHLETHKRELKALYPDVDVHARRFDAADEASVKGVVEEALKKYGRLDVMFANAGIAQGEHLFDTEGESFMKSMRVNALSVFLAAKYAAKAMTVTSASKPYPSGSIVSTASVAGLRSNAGATDYSASKAAVISIMQTAAFQLTGSGVRCNAICPGVIETGMTKAMYDMARARGTQRRIGQLNPLQRGAVADEVARVVLFLASDEASYVNGQAWAVDGGLSAGHPFVPGKLA
ncbi:uncharacterized protein IWZ02DRAFT_486803 [Phyllosticta citriasiana]|uniref:Uncharacterized protein n=1 Tax=Phyllosticta citriasiana TaxID=595635 RepID=A0ABR1KBL9_9PEZI